MSTSRKSPILSVVAGGRCTMEWIEGMRIHEPPDVIPRIRLGFPI